MLQELVASLYVVVGLPETKAETDVQRLEQAMSDDCPTCILALR